MNIISAHYNKDNTTITAVFSDHTACIPCCINSEYLKLIREWEAAGNTITPYSSPVLTWEDIRFERNNLLKETDWTTATDASPKPNKQVWLDYRQQLRDIPQNYTNPEDVVWPTKP